MSAGLAQSGGPVEELKACARMTDSDLRFTCYENLGQRVLAEDTADAIPAATPVAAAAVASEPLESVAAESPAPMPENLGGEQFSDQPEPEGKQYSGLVTTCQKGSDGFWYFRFENGQVWKHVNIVKGRYGDCNFNATITEERMGHKMQVDGDDSKVRVTRIR